LPGSPGLTGLRGPAGAPGAPGNVSHVEGGAVYVRWGRKSCGSQSALLYEGELNYYYVSLNVSLYMENIKIIL